MGYNEADVGHLGAKLEALDVTEGEAAALRALLSFAARNPTDLDGLEPTGAGSLAPVLQRLLFEPVPA